MSVVVRVIPYFWRFNIWNTGGISAKTSYANLIAFQYYWLNSS